MILGKPARAGSAKQTVQSVSRASHLSQNQTASARRQTPNRPNRQAATIPKTPKQTAQTVRRLLQFPNRPKPPRIGTSGAPRISKPPQAALSDCLQLRSGKASIKWRRAMRGDAPTSAKKATDDARRCDYQTNQTATRLERDHHARNQTAANRLEPGSRTLSNRRKPSSARPPYAPKPTKPPSACAHFKPPKPSARARYIQTAQTVFGHLTKPNRQTSNVYFGTAADLTTFDQN